jgi:protease IV
MDPDQQQTVPAPPVPQQHRPVGSNALVAWIVGGVALCLVLLIMVFFCGTCFMLTAIFRGGHGNGPGVGLIEVTGILASDSTGISGGTTSQSVVDQLHAAVENDRIKAVLIRVDSPGGTPAAAEEIYQEVKRTSRSKPVVVSIGDLGASAAYYLSAAADVIYALPDSDVGSIGVILQIPNIQGLDEKIGVHWYVYTQGQYKDIGSPLRPPTEAESAILQEQMRVAYDHFIRDVALGRHMPEPKVRELATGLTFPGTQARDLGLIDTIGNYRDALARAGRMGGIKGDVTVITLERSGPFGLFSDLLNTFKDISSNLSDLVKDTGSNGSATPPQEQ